MLTGCGAALGAIGRFPRGVGLTCMTCRPRDRPAKPTITAPNYAGRILSMGYSNNLDVALSLLPFRKPRGARYFNEMTGDGSTTLIYTWFKKKIHPNIGLILRSIINSNWPTYKSICINQIYDVGQPYSFSLVCCFLRLQI